MGPSHGRYNLSVVVVIVEQVVLLVVVCDMVMQQFGDGDHARCCCNALVLSKQSNCKLMSVKKKKKNVEKEISLTGA